MFAVVCPALSWISLSADWRSELSCADGGLVIKATGRSLIPQVLMEKKDSAGQESASHLAPNPEPSRPAESTALWRHTQLVQIGRTQNGTVGTTWYQIILPFCLLYWLQPGSLPLLLKQDFLLNSPHSMYYWVVWDISSSTSMAKETMKTSTTKQLEKTLHPRLFPISFQGFTINLKTFNQNNLFFHIKIWVLLCQVCF